MTLVFLFNLCNTIEKLNITMKLKKIRQEKLMIRILYNELIFTNLKKIKYCKMKYIIN